MSKGEVIKRAEELLLNKLQERQSVEISCIGTFSPQLQQEYIQEKNDGTRWLIPPSIGLRYTPAPYLLASEHYTRLDFHAPEEYLSRELVTPIADLSGVSEGVAKEILEEELRVILTDLFRGRRVTLLNLGDFFISEEVAGLLLLNFVPAPELLMSLSTPFSAFSPTMLAPGKSFPELEIHGEEPEEVLVQVAIPQAEPEISPEPIPEPEPEILSETPLTPEPTPEHSHKQVRQKSSYWWLTILPIALAILFAHIHIVHSKREKASAKTEQATKSEPVLEQIPAMKLEPAIVPLGEVQISQGVTLAKIAREFYGNHHYWVFIYFANADVIKNPDNVPLGTKLTIPDLRKYGHDGDTPAAEHEAKQWEKLISSHQFTSYDEQLHLIKPLETP